MRMRRLTGRAKAAVVILAVLAAVAGGFAYINANLRPVLAGLANARVQSAAARAMNDSILDILANNGETYDELIKIHATESKVYLLQADSSKLNSLAADCAEAAQLRIAEMGEQGISVPIGTVSGIPIFAGYGPKIRLSFTPAGAVRSSFDSEFRSAGINQTLHRINLRLIATVRVILPGESHTLTVEAEAPIAENIIVGEVPNAYTNVASEEDLLNLIPDND